MEAFKEAIAASKEQACIFKGNQTKQQCPQSPIPLSISPLIHSSSERVREEETTALDESKNNALGNDLAKRRKDDEEDLNIAKCLILLSQGQYSLAHNNRFSSRRFLETSSSNGAGYYVYQCKTCDRTFSSFQALGGHRASHKKPKATYSKFDLKNNIYQNDAVSLVSSYNSKNSNDRSLVSYGNKTSNNKVHECGICGTEFTSGQALGGHMRRHRGAVVVTAVPPIVTVANTELSLSPMSFDQDHVVMPERKRAKNTVVSLDLDLNLPAPEDENRVNGFSFGSKQKEEPKSLVFSAPTLVDCHY